MIPLRPGERDVEGRRLYSAAWLDEFVEPATGRDLRLMTFTLLVGCLVSWAALIWAVIVAWRWTS